MSAFFFEKFVDFPQESGRIHVELLLPCIFWWAMTSDSAIFYSQSSVSVDAVPCAESAQEVQELSELLRLVDVLPTECQPDFYKVLDRLAACLERRQRMLGYVQDSLNQMSLDLKYLIFDLEATRRERDEYRHLLDS
jgi:hypothetical protein